MINKVALLTVIYPTSDLYIEEFFSAICIQTFINFDVLIVNDGYDKFTELKNKYSKLNIVELPTKNNISKNREILINYAIKQNYTYAVFADIDDTFTENRIEHSVELLKHNDIVVNDLTSFKNDKIIRDNILSKRIKNRSTIDLNFVLNKNIFGLSNTAINISTLPLKNIVFPKDLIAVDWYFFTLLLLKGKKAIFSSETLTLYRQHEENTVGISEASKESIKKALIVKKIHYKNLSCIEPIFKTLEVKINLLNEHINCIDNLEKLVNRSRKEIKYPLWWETAELRNKHATNTQSKNR